MTTRAKTTKAIDSTDVLKGSLNTNALLRMLPKFIRKLHTIELHLNCYPLGGANILKDHNERK